jgi:MFS family permease
VIGGIAVALAGWRAIFAVNVPVVLVVLFVLRRHVDRFVDDTRTDRSESHDGGRVLNAVFTSACSTQALATFAQYALLLAVPIILDARGWSAAAVGFALSLLTLGMVLVGPAGGRFGDRFGRRRPVVLGLALALVVVAAAAALGDDVSSPSVLVMLLVFGIGLGAAMPGVTTAGMEAAPPGRVSTAAGVLSASRYVGSIVAALVLAGVVEDDGSGLAVMLAVCAIALTGAVTAARWLPARPVRAPD